MSAIRRGVCVAAALLPMVSLPNAAQAADTDYPNKAIRLIVPFPAGSGPDANARVLVVNAALAAKNVKELIALAKGKPGELTFGSAGTPRAMITRLQAATAETLKSTEVTERLTNVSAGYIVGSTSEEYAAFIQSERAKWARVIRQTGVKLAL